MMQETPQAGMQGGGPLQMHATPGQQNPTPFASVGAGGSTMGGGSLEDQYAAAQGPQMQGQAYGGQTQAYGQAAIGSAVAAGGEMNATTQREWERLRKVEEELKRKEKMLKQRELELGKFVAQQPNWPRHVPCVKPQVYHDIDAEVTPLRTKFMKSLYTSYYLLCVLIVYQLFVDLFVMLGDDKKENDRDEPDWSEHFGLSVLYLLGLCFGFMIWYWPTYKAVANRIPSQYRMAFLGLVVAILFDVIMFVGYVGHGGTGILFTTAVMDKKKSDTLGIMAVVGCIIWFLHGVYLIFAFYRVKTFYNEDVLRSAMPEAMRNAAAGMMTSAQSVLGARGSGPAAGGEAGAGRTA